MKKLLYLLYLSSFLSCAQEPKEVTMSSEGIVADLPFLKEKILDTHPDPFYASDKAAFEQKMNDLLANGKHYSAEKAYVKMLEIIASIGDGHTNFWPFNYYQAYPIEFSRFEDRIQVSGIGKMKKHLLGYELKAVDGVPLDQFISSIHKLVPHHETEEFTWNWTLYYLRVAQIMYGLEVAKSNEQITYTLSNELGEEKTLTLSVVGASNVELVYPYEKAPMFYDAREEGFWFEDLGNGLIYFHFSSYPSRSTFSKMGKTLDKVLAEGATKTLFIDLRRNGGGDFTKGRKLIDKIEATVRERNIPVYVATSRRTFSAAIANAADFRQRLNATLLGEPTGGRPIGYQETNIFYLPTTGIRGSVSSILYKFQEEDTPGVLPDVDIPYTWEDYRSGRDPILDYLTTQTN